MGPITDPHKVIWTTSVVFPQTVRFYLYLWPFFWEGGELLTPSSQLPAPNSFEQRFGMALFWRQICTKKPMLNNSAISSQEILLEVVDIRHIQQQPSIGLLCCKSFGFFFGRPRLPNAKTHVSNEKKIWLFRVF